MKPSRSLLLWIAVFLLASPLVLAQSDYARITGKVVDENGDPVSGVTIDFQAAPGSPAPAFTVTTNKKGRFTYPTAIAGQFDPRVLGDWRATRISVKLMGNITLSGGADLDVTLQPGELPPTVGFPPTARIQIGLTLASGAAGGGGGETPEISGLEEGAPQLRKLMDLFEAKDWETLVSESEAILAENPDLGGAYYLRGVAEWQTDATGPAVESIRTAAELIPDQPGINGTLGTLLLEHAAKLKEGGDDASAVDAYGEAADLFHRQVEETPDEIIYLTNRVAALDFAGRTDELVGAIEALLLRDASNATAYLRLAELHVAAGDVDAAYKVLTEMPEGGDSAGSILYNAAVDLWNNGDMDAAIAVADKGIEISPGMADLYRLKAMAYISSDQPKAVELLEKYLAMIPEDTEGIDADRQLLQALKDRL